MAAKPIDVLDAIPEPIRLVQIEASNPATSAWVAANAGSGKTHVLAQRVMRLLLDGVDPTRILCITFTKAAAANMANRVFDELRQWTLLEDEALDAAIRGISGLTADAVLRGRARRLFAMALETPGGLKVQTIHAFCTRLLQQFPFEANVAARFDVLEAAGQAQLLAETSLEVLLEAAQAPSSAIGHALAMAMSAAADRTFKEAISEAIRKRDVLRAWIRHSGNVDAAIDSLCGRLDIAPADTVDGVEREMTEGPLLPVSQWPALAQRLQRGSAKDRDQAARLMTALASPAAERALVYLAVFFKTDLVPRRQLVTGALQRDQPELAELLEAERRRLTPLFEQRKAVVCRDRTAALVTIAEAVISRYEAAKDRRGLLDYDDLIDKALALLAEGGAAWVHYKLDQGIDHVLIDEAQDTSAKQWEIICRLTAEFFAGKGARVVHRTIFAVGDEKQSIFSFQNAAPRAFAEMLAHFRQAHASSGLSLAYCQFKHSFRSGPNVLAAVDQVFATREMRDSVTSDPGGMPPHIALPAAPPGLVEIWEPIKPDAKREIEAWDAPFDEVRETSPQVRLAAKIACNVRRYIGQGTSAGDVLVLVRQRGALFEAIIRALKELDVPVAGADRLVLTEHIAVMDLIALADALLLPDDDLALATVLKSPLFGLSEEDLFAIAWGRKGSLRAALRAKTQDAPRFLHASQKLDRLARFARSELPFSFYARVLGAEQGRMQFLARLGPEADDPLQELLNLALDYERQHTASLQGFIAWLRTAQTEVKRDMEISRNEVRVMTVHGAKGLEAPTVILADTMTPPAGPPHRQPRLLSLPTEESSPGLQQFVWPSKKAHDAVLVRVARERLRGENENEHRRLLYVAMTRASNRLIICGAEGRKRPEGCWWDLVTGALFPLAIEHPADDGNGKIWRYCPFPLREPVHPKPAPAQVLTSNSRPVWLDRAAPRDPVPPVLVAPSHAHGETTSSYHPSPAALLERSKALKRGALTHRLLQVLPDLPLSVRTDAARRYLGRRAKELTVGEREGMIEQICRILNDVQFSQLFLPGSRAELSIVGRLRQDGRPILVSGQIDRIAVTSDTVLIADYKTNSPAPRCIDAVPPAYICQLALYRRTLQDLYPGKVVRGMLLWTQVPDLMEIPASLLESAIAGVTWP